MSQIQTHAPGFISRLESDNFFSISQSVQLYLSDGAARIFSNHLMPWPEFKATSVELYRPGTFKWTFYQLSYLALARLGSLWLQGLIGQAFIVALGSIATKQLCLTFQSKQSVNDIARFPNRLRAMLTFFKRRLQPKKSQIFWPF